MITHMITHVSVFQGGTAPHTVLHDNTIVPPIRVSQIRRALEQHHTIRTFNAHKGSVVAILEPNV